MSEVKSRAIAKLTPETPRDWRSRAGRFFRNLILPFAALARKHVNADELAAAGKDAVIGSAQRARYENECKQAEALKHFADIEKSNLEAEFARRAMEARIKGEESDASQKDAQAKIMQMEAVRKFVELQEWMNEKGLAMVADDDGQFVLVPSKPIDYGELPPPTELIQGEEPNEPS